MSLKLGSALFRITTLQFYTMAGLTPRVIICCLPLILPIPWLKMYSLMSSQFDHSYHLPNLTDFNIPLFNSDSHLVWREHCGNWKTKTWSSVKTMLRFKGLHLGLGCHYIIWKIKFVQTENIITAKYIHSQKI